MTKRKDLLVFVVLCLTWGSTWLAIKIGVNQAPPVLFAGARFAVAGAILLAWYRGRKGPLRIERRDWFSVLVMAFSVISITFGLIFWGEQWVSSGLTSVLVQGLIPISMYLFDVIYGRENIHLLRGIGILLGIVGLIIIFLPVIIITNSQLERDGMLAIIIGTLVYCWGSVGSKRVVDKYSSTLMSGLENLLGGVILLGVGLPLEWSRVVAPQLYLTSSVFLSWIFLVFIGSLIGFTSYSYLLKAWGASKTSVYAFITPLVAIVIGIFLNKETVTLSEGIGTAVILLGIFVNRMGKKQPSHPAVNAKN